MISGTNAVILGQGVFGSTAVSFRLEVQDMGDPGVNDTFRLSWTGYLVSGRLNGGNIQIHK